MASIFKCFVAVFLLTTVVATDSILAARATCASRAFGEITDLDESKSTRATLRDFFDQAQSIHLAALTENSKSDWQKIEGQILGIIHDTFPRETFEVLMEHSFNRQEGRFINLLLNLSNSREFVQKTHAQAGAWYQGYNHNDLRQREPANAKRDYINQAARNIKSIEVGGWRITTTSGDVYSAVYTSRHPALLHLKTANVALDRLMAAHDIKPSDMALVQNFHTHPIGNHEPYSKDRIGFSTADGSAFRHWRSHFFRLDDSPIPFHMYAIEDMVDPVGIDHESYFLVFHMGE